MKNEFFGFYPPEEKEIEDIWNESVIAFDANTLLNLYRYSKSTKNDFLKTLKDYSDRIWLPYQAGYEFHNNRISVIKSQEQTYSEIGDKLDELFQKLESELNVFKRHPFISVDKIKTEFSKKIEKVKNELIKQSEKHPEYLKSDEILPSVTELFEKKIGPKYSDEDLQKIYENGKTRYAKKIPPGFSDIPNKKNKGDRHLYGDLIIWQQLIDKAKAVKSTIIFVTDDRKEDWWLKFKGQTIRPREELIKEFFDKTGFRILIYQADSFLNFAKEKLNSSVKEESIKEVKQVRLEDEKDYENSIINNERISRYGWIDNYYKNENAYKSMNALARQLDTLPKTPNNIADFVKMTQNIPTVPKSILDFIKMTENIPKMPQSTIDAINMMNRIPKPPDVNNNQNETEE
ncbi:PIN-like domain-containing protein [Maribacter aestuarii]|uniref:PIN-like domain-containing protein n=1 Tax=Maribacter aestuarii TaxID=1130723 RepID=UPI0025A58E4F|nr:PIN domain-containing protein [Maribacter aestuarii]